MSTAQERLQRVPLDKWSKREQLCLASAVSCSGDQNWITVSRTVKSVCGNDKRPADWYSQKNCALQYGHMLETVESTKRKKRESGISSPAPVETPTELLLKRLTEERIAEIQMDMKRDQEEYATLYLDVKAIQSGELTETQLREMWRKLQKEQETQRINEMKLENLMREREQRKQEMISSWRSAPAKRATSNTDTTAVDMDVEEISTSTSKTNETQTQQAPATSPLLSSLLKSPTAGNNTSNLPQSGSIARATAPTITTLLTSGTLPTQPVVTIKNNVPGNDNAFMTRPISGPPAADTNTQTTPTGKSPSQSAPTLSMLLEKNKAPNVACTAKNSNTSSLPNTQETQAAGTKPTESDTNNDVVPMEIEDNTDFSQSTVKTNTNIVTTDSEETDPNEEQQLLEVFKNIGNIDDIDIDMTDVIDDEEVDFLESVTALPNEVKEIPKDFENKSDASKLEENKSEMEKKCNENIDKAITDAKPIEVTSSDDSNDDIPLAEVASLETRDRSQSTTECIKDVSDSTSLSAKPDEDLKENTCTTSKCTIDKPEINDTKSFNEESNEETKVSTKLLEENMADENSAETSVVDDEDKRGSPTLPTASGESCSTDLIQAEDGGVFEKPNSASSTDIDKTRSENKEKRTEDVLKKTIADGESSSDLSKMEDSQSQMSETSNEVNSVDSIQNVSKSIDNIKDNLTEIREATPRKPSIISITDTDEDSSMTDASKDDAVGNKSSQQSSTNNKKSLSNTETETKLDTTEKPIATIPISFNQTSSSITSSTSTSTQAATNTNVPARPPMFRKLRDRDRSESPMIDDETTNTTTASDHSTKHSNSRRRYSSTPVIDSIPNSPASSEHTDDRRETRGASKKIFLSIYSTLYDSKHATIFRKSFNDEHSQKYAELCYRPLDLPSIKRNIDSGVIRSISELQRDVMVMVQHTLMLYRPTTTHHKTALAFLQECHAIKEFVAVDKCPLVTASAVKARSGARKSQRLI